MKRTLLAVAASAVLAVGSMLATETPAAAHSSFNFSLSLGYPCCGYYQPYYPYPGHDVPRWGGFYFGDFYSGG